LLVGRIAHTKDFVTYHWAEYQSEFAIMYSAAYILDSVAHMRESCMSNNNASVLSSNPNGLEVESESCVVLDADDRPLPKFVQRAGPAAARIN